VIEVPWASVGQVVVANGGDIAKELGLFHAAAGVSHASTESPAVVPEAEPQPKLTLVYERSFITCAHAGDRVIENIPIANLQDFIIEFVVLSGDGMPGIDFRGTTSSRGYVLLVGRFISSDGSSNDLRLWKLFGQTNILDVNSSLVPSSPPYRVTIEVNVTTADMWVDGSYAGKFSNISGVGTDLGLSCMNFSGASTVTVGFFDIRVWTYWRAADPGAGEPSTISAALAASRRRGGDLAAE